MPFPFTCPHCGRETSVDDHYAGQTGPCAGCRKPVTIPGTRVPAPFKERVKRFGSNLIMILAIACVLVMLVLCGGVLFESPEPSRRMQCTNNLKQIGLAMHNYHDTYQSLPPAYIADEDGKPMHSWRVLILPFIEEQYLYDQYDFDEPWDSPNNLALADLMPEVYACPSHPVAGNTQTCYAMIVGPGTISDGPTASRFRDVLDGTSNTLLVIETSGDGFNWLEPVDLDATQIDFIINSGDPGGIQSDHPGGVNALICDGSVHFLGDSTPYDLLEIMATIADGQAVGDFGGF